jgi:hypothetical protein
MAIRNLLQGLGQRVGRGLMEVGGYDPMQQVSPEEAAKRRSEGLSALQRSLGRSAAILSGDPRRVQFAEQQMQMVEQEKKQEELNKKLDDAIDKSNLPQSQKNLLKSLNVQTKAQTLMQTFEPKEKKYPAKYEEYLLTDPTPTMEEFKEYAQPTKLPTSAEEINKLKLNAINTLFKYEGSEEKFKKAEPALYKIYENLVKRNDEAGFLQQLLSGEGDLQYTVKRKG